MTASHRLQVVTIGLFKLRAIKISQSNRLPWIQSESIRNNLDAPTFTRFSMSIPTVKMYVAHQ